MKDRAVRLREIALAGDTLQLAPGLTAGMTIGPDVATAEPAVIGAIWIGAEMRLGVDGAPTSAGEADEGRWGARRCGAGIGPLRTGLAQRFTDQPRKGLGFFGAFASALVGFAERVGHGEWLVGQPDMDEETDEDESHHEKLVKQRVRRHDEILFHGDERGPFYRIRPLLNYPLHSHTRPVLVGCQGRGVAEGVPADFRDALLLEALIFQQP